ncbi:unnamed protein product [Commensalibacter communis]|uniref:Uncharacterized protein n=1 Tax=Commensalibacter communis TaxID=2972786 RepID=A0A9W4X7G2_9PROT|nr:unnamed protein product [Commensalibacter communis]CAI3950858.1 unnamed protein product [Commensalibacter communis]CAI3952135.1 unnamed protein product [Commensalibacter communis]CAI3953283.1 unnamed protein product [Commensalibacter communis]CAI3954297.1 unnamed protein product [Commensalibacter communis]
MKAYIAVRDVKIKWVAYQQGGRKEVPTNNRYYPLARFPEIETEIDWFNHHMIWSVVLDLGETSTENGDLISYAKVRFLVDDAPHERFTLYSFFEIYEGPKKVGDVFLLNNK